MPINVAKQWGERPFIELSRMMKVWRRVSINHYTSLSFDSQEGDPIEYFLSCLANSFFILILPFHLGGAHHLVLSRLAIPSGHKTSTANESSGHHIHHLPDHFALLRSYLHRCFLSDNDASGAPSPCTSTTNRVPGSAASYKREIPSAEKKDKQSIACVEHAAVLFLSRLHLFRGKGGNPTYHPPLAW